MTASRNRKQNVKPVIASKRLACNRLVSMAFPLPRCAARGSGRLSTHPPSFRFRASAAPGCSAWQAAHKLARRRHLALAALDCLVFSPGTCNLLQRETARSVPRKVVLIRGLRGHGSVPGGNAGR
jgi:hypothetical protein